MAQQNTRIKLITAGTAKIFNEEIEKFAARVNVKIIDYHIRNPVGLTDRVEYAVFVEYVELN